MGAWFAEQVMIKIRLSGESFRAEVRITEATRPQVDDQVVLWAALGDVRSGNGCIVGTGAVIHATPTTVVVAGTRLRERWGRRELTAAKLDALLPTGTSIRPLEEALVSKVLRARLPTNQPQPDAQHAAPNRDKRRAGKKRRTKSVWARPSGFSQ